MNRHTRGTYSAEGTHKNSTGQVHLESSGVRLRGKSALGRPCSGHACKSLNHHSPYTCCGRDCAGIARPRHILCSSSARDCAGTRSCPRSRGTAVSPNPRESVSPHRHHRRVTPTRMLTKGRMQTWLLRRLCSQMPAPPQSRHE